MIRQAQAADVETVQALLGSLADHDGATMLAGSDALLRHGFGARPLFTALLAEDAGTAVGLVVFFPYYSTHRGQPGVFVQDLYVAPARRGTGLGRQLLRAAGRAARRDWGAEFLALLVERDNAAARAFYLGRGFEAVEGYGQMILEKAGFDSLTGA